MMARPRFSIESHGPGPPRSLRVDDRDERESASETPSTANPLRDLVASLRTVQLPGSPATYANRAVLREMGLRWDPVGHRWYGTTTAGCMKELRERLGLVVKCFGDMKTPPKGRRRAEVRLAGAPP